VILIDLPVDFGFEYKKCDEFQQISILAGFNQAKIMTAAAVSLKDHWNDLYIPNLSPDNTALQYFFLNVHASITIQPNRDNAKTRVLEVFEGILDKLNSEESLTVLCPLEHDPSCGTAVAYVDTRVKKTLPISFCPLYFLDTPFERGSTVFHELTHRQYETKDHPANNPKGIYSFYSGIYELTTKCKLTSAYNYQWFLEYLNTPDAQKQAWRNTKLNREGDRDFKTPKKKALGKDEKEDNIAPIHLSGPRHIPPPRRNLGQSISHFFGDPFVSNNNNEC